jgi:hypothetical protein
MHVVRPLMSATGHLRNAKVLRESAACFFVPNHAQ